MAVVVRRLFGAKVENNQEFSKFGVLEHKKLCQSYEPHRQKLWQSMRFFRFYFP